MSLSKRLRQPRVFQNTIRGVMLLGVARNGKRAVALWAEPDFVGAFALPHNMASCGFEQTHKLWVKV